MFFLKWGLGLWPIFSFKFNHIASRFNFSRCKNCKPGKWQRHVGFTALVLPIYLWLGSEVVRRRLVLLDILSEKAFQWISCFRQRSMSYDDFLRCRLSTNSIAITQNVLLGTSSTQPSSMALGCQTQRFSSGTGLVDSSIAPLFCQSYNIKPI